MNKTHECVISHMHALGHTLHALGHIRVCVRGRERVCMCACLCVRVRASFTHACVTSHMCVCVCVDVWVSVSVSTCVTECVRHFTLARVRSHMHALCHIWLRLVWRSHITNGWVMAPIKERCRLRTSHITYGWGTWHIYESWCIWLSRPTYERAMSDLNQDVTYGWGMWHVDESWVSERQITRACVRSPINASSHSYTLQMHPTHTHEYWWGGGACMSAWGIWCNYMCVCCIQCDAIIHMYDISDMMQLWSMWCNHIYVWCIRCDATMMQLYVCMLHQMWCNHIYVWCIKYDATIWLYDMSNMMQLYVCMLYQMWCNHIYVCCIKYDANIYMYAVSNMVQLSNMSPTRCIASLHDQNYNDDAVDHLWGGYD